MCAAPIPQDQGSNSCSMCYGDIEHGKDGYYRQQLEREYQQQLEEASNQRQEF
jgi:hypothetical protein